MKIAELGEFGLIERIRAHFLVSDKDVIVGIGDDVAVLASRADLAWLATCDVQVEGSHFLREKTSPRDLGWKALAINVSDVASAGGRPRFALVSLGLPPDLGVEYVDELYVGMREAADAYGLSIVGGNMTKSESLFVDIFLLGEARREDVMLRSGAHAGDKIMVTGQLGDAAAGVALLLKPELTASATYAATARARRDRPTPRPREGALVARSHLASAMIDLSDGLSSDLGHICEQSHVSARVFANHIPAAAENKALSRKAHGSEWHFALHGGEDYELLFTAPSANARELARIVEGESGTPVSTIGEVLPPGVRSELILPDGTAAGLTTLGWDHFRSAGA